MINVRRLVLGCVIALGVLALGAGSASAVGYGNICSTLGEPSFCAEPHDWAFAVAVDNSGDSSAGDVYLTTLGVVGNSAVWKFNALGEAVSFKGANPDIVGNELRFPGETIGAVGVTVDSATGHLFVTNREPDTVEEFTAEGEPVPAGTIKLPPGTNAVGIGVDDACYLQKKSGTECETLYPSNGDIYVADEPNQTVYEYKPNGELLRKSQVESAHPLVAYTLAVDANGHVYVANLGGKVQKFSEELAFEEELGENNSRSVAIDPSTGIIYISYGSPASIQQYDSAGIPIGSPFGSLSESYGIAVSGASESAHFVYAAANRGGEGNNGVIFEPGEIPEAPVTGGATEITGVTAKLHGVVNPGSKSTVRYHFAYNAGLSCEGGGETEAGEVKEGKNVSVETEATRLQPDAQYTFCLVATNKYGHLQGLGEQFKTGPLPPAVDGEGTSGVTAFDANLSAQINPENQVTMCLFEYGLTTEARGSAVACPEELIGFGDQSVSVDIGGALKPGTTYYYHVIAQNGANEKTDGTVQSFSTVGPPPVSSKVEGISRTGVLLSGTVDPEGVDAHYYFEYGTTSGYGHRTPLADAGSGLVVQTIPQVVVSELLPGTVYHYRLVATNEAGTTEGPVETFTTAPPTPPIITTGPANGISENDATITATITTEGLPVSYGFEMGTSSTAYGPPTGLGFVGAGLNEVTVALSLSGLQPDTTYHYRVTARNVDGTSYGSDQFFTTSVFGGMLTEPLTPPLIATPTIAFPTRTEVNTGKPIKSKTIHAKGKKRRKTKRTGEGRKGKSRKGKRRG